MSGPARVLAFVERQVASHEREAYLLEVEDRRVRAHSARAHFWVFEHSAEPGRFVEFTEAADADAVSAAHGGALPAPVWREVKRG